MRGRGTILNFPDTAAAEGEAAAWVARFDAGDVSARDQAAFQEWLNRSPLHRDLIAQYGSLWSEFDALGALPQGASAGARGAGAAALAKKATPWLAACAAAVLVVGGGLAYLKRFEPLPVHNPQAARPVARPAAIRRVAAAPSPSPAPTRIDYQTGIGGQKKITLADGSSVILNTNSLLKVDFSGNRRIIRLLRGEAFFDVIHDKTRPFIVYAHNYVVRDIGTAFDIHVSRTGLVEVGVTRGSVEVAPAGQAPGGVKSLGILAAGRDIVLGQKVESLDAATSADLVRKLAWRQGALIYTGQPLQEVLADISRYSDIKIELADPALKQLPVGGSFRIDQIQAIIAALENNFGLHAEWLDAQHVRFSAARGLSKS